MYSCIFRQNERIVLASTMLQLRNLVQCLAKAHLQNLKLLLEHEVLCPELFVQLCVLGFARQ